MTRLASLRARVARFVPVLILALAGAFFLAPLITMARFALQNVLVAKLGWSTLFDRWSFSAFTKAMHEHAFGSTLVLSLKLVVGTLACTLALLLPTVLYVHLRLPRARALVELFTILPYVVPPIALVAGVTAFFRPNARWFINSNYSLVPFYVVLALPFSYRALDAGIRAIDIRTLVDASRSLGAGWARTLVRALVPNLLSAILSASFLTATVVLGEFTIASALSKKTFPVFTFEYQSRSARGGVALALLVLVCSTVLLMILTRLVGRRSGRRLPNT